MRTGEHFVLSTENQPGSIKQRNFQPSRRRALVCIALACIAILYAFRVGGLHPANLFGLTQDDTIYFSSAQALADGHGYVLPSVPGTPQATKYPILFPWILSAVWRLNPSFPQNVNCAVAVVVIFGWGFLVASFLLLRQFGGIGDAGALLLTLFCAMHPAVLLYSASVLTEIPFAALALAAILLADSSLRKSRDSGLAALSGIFTGLSALTRAFGAPVAAGIFLYFLYRRSWRRAAVFAACAAPFFAGLLWRAIVMPPTHAPMALAMTVPACARQWRETWLYYTNYFAFWKLTVMQGHVFWPMLRDNTILLLQQPGLYFIDPQFVRPPLLGLALAAILSAIAVIGIVHNARREGAGPVHFVLAIYIIPILLWDYPAAERFLIPFLPLFVAGLWMEGKHLAQRALKVMRGRGPAGEKIAAICILAICVMAITDTGWTYWAKGRFLARMSATKGKLLRDKRQAYAWLKENTPPDARVIAYEDPSVFLYSGRQATRAMFVTPVSQFDPQRLQQQLACMGATAEAVGAKFWLVSSDDFEIEGPAAGKVQQREEELTRTMPLQFSSSDGEVKIYSLNTAKDRIPPRRWEPNGQGRGGGPRQP